MYINNEAIKTDLLIPKVQKCMNNHFLCSKQKLFEEKYLGKKYIPTDLLKTMSA